MKKNRLLTLFTAMLSISAFTFGGGFVIVSLMKRKLVDELGWLSEEEMLDMTALAQSAPGAIAVNASILVGRRVAGLPGLFAAVLGTLIPPVVIIGLISLIYAQFASNEWVKAALAGMSCGVAAVIADVVAGLGGKVLRGHEPFKIVLMVMAFIMVLTGANVILIILLAAGIGAGHAFIVSKGGEG